MKTLYLNIKGMTCASCEVLIERKLKVVNVVTSVHVNHANGHARVECNDNITFEQLKDAVDPKYTIELHKEQRQSGNMLHIEEKRSWGEIGAAFIVIAGVYLILKQFNAITGNFGIC